MLPQPRHSERRHRLRCRHSILRRRAVPQQVTALQARRALRATGLYETVKTAVDAAADADVHDSWEYAAVWHRDAMWIDALGTQLHLSPEQIDALFVQAASL